MRYIIKDYTEETVCDWCGCPLLPGDRAVMSRDESRVYCNDSEQRAWDAAERRESAGLTGRSIYFTA